MKRLVIGSILFHSILVAAGEVFILDVTKLMENLNQVIVVDGRGEDSYQKGHIPGSVMVDWQSELEDFVRAYRAGRFHEFTREVSDVQLGEHGQGLTTYKGRQNFGQVR